MQFRYVPATGPSGFTQGAGSGATFTSVLSNATFVSRTEVTQGQWKAATSGTNPACFQLTSGTSCTTSNANDSGPVENMVWSTAAAYANWLSAQVGLTRCYTFTPTDWDQTVTNWAGGTVEATAVAWSGPSCTGYRLLTESEYEWAQRGPVAAGTLTTLWFWGDSFNASYVWYASNSGNRTNAVGGLLPNAYGLRDIAGNVNEWVWDWHDTYPSGSQSDYAGPASGTIKISRGGGFTEGENGSRSAGRGGDSYGERRRYVGFRLARTAP